MKSTTGALQKSLRYLCPVLNPLYKIKEEIVPIGSFDIRLLRVTNIDELFELLVAKGDDTIEVQDERIPYWADLWPSAIALARYLVEQNVLPASASVLEIGCGLGLPGIVAGKLGAQVTFSDYIEEPLEFAKQNWLLNNASEARFSLVDWRNLPGKIEEDIILASDVAYEKRSFTHLLGLITDAVAAGKTVLLSEPGRKYAEPFTRELYERQLVKSSALYTIPLNGMDNRVTVFELGR